MDKLLFCFRCVQRCNKNELKKKKHEYTRRQFPTQQNRLMSDLFCDRTMQAKKRVANENQTNDRTIIYYNYRVGILSAHIALVPSMSKYLCIDEIKCFGFGMRNR